MHLQISYTESVDCQRPKNKGSIFFLFKKKKKMSVSIITLVSIIAPTGNPKITHDKLNKTKKDSPLFSFEMAKWDHSPILLNKAYFKGKNWL